MNETIIKRLGALMSVKSIVTIVLTAVFAYLAIVGQISQEFMMVYTVVVAFYFGTQGQKVQDALDVHTEPAPASVTYNYFPRKDQETVEVREGTE